MSETINFLFQSRDKGHFELQVKESWSGRTVRGNFIPPYTTKQLNLLLKKLNTLQNNNTQNLREIGYRLFLSLCGMDVTSPLPLNARPHEAEQSVQALLRGVIQRTLRRRGTVALTFSFGVGCDEFVRYPWELLHNGDLFLLGSGIFTLTRALIDADDVGGCELPVHPPMRVLYIGSSPLDCAPLETEISFEALERGFSPLIASGQVFLDRLEPPTFDQLVRYLSSYGGAGVFDDSDTSIPCYIVHFDGHGAYGRLCPNEECKAVNDAEVRRCTNCGQSLSRVNPQTYLCFCNEEGYNQFIDAQSLRDLFVSSDVRLAVFSACETAMVAAEGPHCQKRPGANPVDASLATALVSAQVPAVVAMPFSLQDDLSPTFMSHFYEALADGRTLEEALARARQAMLPLQQSWFIPVLYRRVTESDVAPVPLLVSREQPEEHDAPLAHLGSFTTFVGRERELRELDALLLAVSANGANARTAQRQRHNPHHIAVTGSAGIGKSALALEVVRRHQDKFPGGVVGVSLEGGKTFHEALIEIIHYLHIPTRLQSTVDSEHRARLVMGTLRSLASRELPCLLLLDAFEEVRDRNELETWLQFICALPAEVTVLVTSQSNPENMLALENAHCRWYEYRVGKMTDADQLQLFMELAQASGLDQRIHLDDPYQQEILREICSLLDGYPLGAELIFGTARTIEGQVYTPEAATRSLEEVRDELRSSPLAGILTVLEVSSRRLSASARLLLAYLSAFKLPFSREQIALLFQDMVAGTTDGIATLASASLEDAAADSPLQMLVRNWRASRDELVQSSFVQFDGRVYTIHPQIRHFAVSQLPGEERRRVHRIVASYYMHLPQPSPEEWFAAFEHLESAGESQDLQNAVSLAVRASWALYGRGYTAELRAMLQRAGVHAVRLHDTTGEGRIQCCMGALMRHLGRYMEAEACLRSSLAFHQQKGEAQDAAWALYELAVLSREEANFAQAEAYLEEAKVNFVQAQDERGSLWLALVRGELQRGYGNYRPALELFEQAVKGLRQLKDQEGYAWALRDLGATKGALGYYTRALTDNEEALRTFDNLNMVGAQAWVLADRGEIYLHQGKLDAAQQQGRESLRLFQAQSMLRGEGWSLRLLGNVARARGDVEHAQLYYNEALRIFASLSDRVDEARVLNALGAVAYTRGEYQEAQSYYEQALTRVQEQNVLLIEAQTLWGLGDIARAWRRFSEAEHYYTRSGQFADRLALPAMQCAVLRRQGLLRQAEGKYQDALRYLVQALVLDQRQEHPVRQELAQCIHTLVREQHLDDEYSQLKSQYALA
ncbi:tetratricopeptide repeat protein [Ktedonobacter robiniae]|uniref:AAA+ ATPase domain-containing protein n=1 Tax=Ktedonobacter robiniae TaxID=2778365 RepID=A0ABQ3UFU9_9CHLR|nr:tetratricopeptide repeat protein [Ktedonobacter robiniae]GHO51588.1 hypothetical protein KSB_00630 [Ktedonobacter robiniae]